MHINRFGVIPKKHQPGKWRLITDLSFPEGANAISPEISSLSYTTVGQVAAAAMALGKGSLIAKIDIKVSLSVNSNLPTRLQVVRDEVE